MKLLTNNLVHEAIKYALVGGVCTVLDMSLLYSITRFMRMDYLAASIISFVLGATLNYVLCVNWIFDFRRIQNQRHEFIWYLAVTAVVLAVNTALMWGLTDMLHLHFMHSKFITIFFTYVLNFSLRKYLLHTSFK